jgi:hypothetical protein
MSEQQAATESPRPHPESTGIHWGDSISMERQQELQGYLDRWEAESDHRSSMSIRRTTWFSSSGRCDPAFPAPITTCCTILRNCFERVVLC